MDWFAVRHVIKNHDLYEERITLWRSKDADDAIRRAAVEADQYVGLWDDAAVLMLPASSRSDSATHQPTGLKCSH